MKHTLIGQSILSRDNHFIYARNELEKTVVDLKEKTGIKGDIVDLTEKLAKEYSAAYANRQKPALPVWSIYVNGLKAFSSFCAGQFFPSIILHEDDSVFSKGCGIVNPLKRTEIKPYHYYDMVICLSGVFAEKVSASTIDNQRNTVYFRISNNTDILRAIR